MQIVTDNGCDLNLSPDEAAGLGITIVPLSVTLDGKSYLEGADFHSRDFFPLLERSGNMPTTSQPSAGTFAQVYRDLARRDPAILSIHISSGLSGTLNSAIAGAKEVPEAKVTFVDTKTLSVGAGWQVSTAARAIQARWPEAQILALLDRIRAATETMFTLRDLHYLIHGGRISHIKGLVASVLNIKPIIGVEKVEGKYAQKGQARSFPGAIQTLAGLMEATYSGKAGPIRAQVVQADNPEGASALKDAIAERLRCTWLPTSVLSLVLSAHTGPTMIGAVLAPVSVFEGLA
jgi:DegV family protein with EDD domain